MRHPKTSIIIHGFALLHVAAAVLCRIGDINDDLILTSLTIFLTVILCQRHRQSVEFSAIVIIIANIVGYLMGTGIASFVNLFVSHPLLSPAIATFITTETIGWALLLFLKQYSSQSSSDRKTTHMAYHRDRRCACPEVYHKAFQFHDIQRRVPSWLGRDDGSHLDLFRYLYGCVRYHSTT